MIITDLSASIHRIAEELNAPIKDFGNNIFGLYLTLQYQDNITRRQYVFVRPESGAAQGRDTYYINSRIAPLTPQIDLYKLVRQMSLYTYSNLTFNQDRDANGQPVEMIIIQSSPLVDHCTEEMLKYIIWEVGNAADYMENLVQKGRDDN